MKLYTKKARSIAEYSMMRGVSDFSNAAQFNLYESGYAHLIVISKPVYLRKLAEEDKDVKRLLDVFCHILEYEFKGLDGIDDITTESLEITDGISTIETIGKVVMQSNAEVSMQFTEKSGAVITNFLQYYLEGIKDPRTQAKTYHGLIKSGKLAAGFENEVFNLLYMVTDNTMLNLEKAYLLCNAWPTKANTSIFNTEKGSIEKKDIDVSFQCFVLSGPEVDASALKALAYINETDAVYNTINNIEENMDAQYKGGTTSASIVGKNAKTDSDTDNIVKLSYRSDVSGNSTTDSNGNTVTADNTTKYSGTALVDSYLSGTDQ